MPRGAKIKGCNRMRGTHRADGQPVNISYKATKILQLLIAVAP